MLLLLLLIRPYFDLPPAQFASSKHTHVCTVGSVSLVRREQDGDLHIRLVADGAFVVAEIIPSLPVAGADTIREGDRLTVCGIRRYDDEHKWWEVHPVERFAKEE